MTRAQPQWIFIICAARSGSKYLRDLLAASPEVAVVPYDVNFLWRRGQEWSPDDALTDVPGGHCGDGIRGRLIELSRWSATGSARFIVEKSVSNSLRVPFLATLFPEGKFIHLVRDGRAVVESARRMWGRNIEPGYLMRKFTSFQPADWRYGAWFALNQLRRFWPAAKTRPVWGPRYPGIEEDVRRMDLTDVCTRQWIESVSRASIALDAVEPGRRFILRYEDLVCSSDALRDLCHFIGITDITPVIDAHIRDTQAHHLDGWRTRLATRDQQHIQAAAGDWLNRLGYLSASGCEKWR